MAVLKVKTKRNSLCITGSIFTSSRDRTRVIRKPIETKIECLNIRVERVERVEHDDKIGQYKIEILKSGLMILFNNFLPKHKYSS